MQIEINPIQFARNLRAHTFLSPEGDKICNSRNLERHETDLEATLVGDRDIQVQDWTSFKQFLIGFVFNIMLNFPVAI